MTELTEPPAEGPQFINAPWTDTLATVETSEFAARTAKHLREDPVIWVTTVGPGGLPAPNPVWFLWDGADTIRLFAMPQTVRVRNLRKNSRVSLNLAGDALGVQVCVLTGTAELDEGGAPALAYPDFVSKYEEWFPRVMKTPVSYSEDYSVPIVVNLSRVRGF
jgi:PPOX class probable F420-dependent enzyme